MVDILPAQHPFPSLLVTALGTLCETTSFPLTCFKKSGQTSPNYHPRMTSSEYLIPLAMTTGSSVLMRGFSRTHAGANGIERRNEGRKGGTEGERLTKWEPAHLGNHLCLWGGKQFLMTLAESSLRSTSFPKISHLCEPVNVLFYLN